MLNLLQGKRRAGAMVNLPNAGAANALAIFTVSTIASMVGVKTIIIRRLIIRNNACGNTWVHIGTGVAGAFVHALPAFFSVNNSTDEYEEDALPGLELLATITAYPDVVGAGSFDVQVEVEERG